MQRLDDPLIGVPVYGGFVIERLLGEGGMGAVYAALDRELDKRIAVKVLLPIHSSNVEVLARFLGEARAASRIGHDNIVRIEAKGTLPDGRAYVAMEYLDGVGLDAYLEHQVRLDVAHALAILVQIGAALDAAHAVGIVHRDIKPPNIFVTRRPGFPLWIKVLDFGIARFLGPSRSDGVATREGMVIGTPSFMPPEQAIGATTVDHRADVYALGVLAHLMVTGQLPVSRQGFVDWCPPRELVPTLPAAWSDAILWALRFQPAERPYRVVDWLRALVAATPDGAAIAEANAPGLLTGHRADTAPPFAVPASGAFPTTPTTLGSAAGSIAPRPGRRSRVVWSATALVALATFGAALIWIPRTSARDAASTPYADAPVMPDAGLGSRDAATASVIVDAPIDGPIDAPIDARPARTRPKPRSTRDDRPVDQRAPLPTDRDGIIE